MSERVVLFDVDGVLIDGYHARPERLQHRWDENLQRDLGIDPEGFRDEFIYDLFVKKVIIGEMSVVEALEAVLPGFGYIGSPMAVLTYWLSHDSKLNTALLDAIRRLRVSCASPLFVATNQEHIRAHWLWQTLGMSDLFEDIFYSARLGVAKPDPSFFSAIETRIGPFDQPPLFFDDSRSNIEAAKACGWDAVQFNTIEDFTPHPFIAAHLV